MARLHTGIIVFCLLSALACTTHAEERIIGTVRLLEDRILFTDPAISTGKSDQFVKVICHSGENNSSATITNDPVYPLARVRAGETLTILNIIRCEYTRGGYVQARNQNNITGYTLLPNYHTHIQTTDAEAAYKVLYLIVPPCIQTQYADPECRVTGYAEPFARYTRLYPNSPRTPNAAEKAAMQYRFAADIFQYLVNNPAGHPTLNSYTTRYTRTALLAKANEYRKLELQMQALANQKTAQPSAPQQTAAPQQPPPPQIVAAQPTSLNDPPIQPAKQPEPSKPAPQTAALQQPTPPPQLPPISPTSWEDTLTYIFYSSLILLILAYIVVYHIRHRRITHRTPDYEIGMSIIELFAFGITASVIPLFLPAYLKPVMIPVLALCLYLRLDARLEPARKQRAAVDLKTKQDTLTELAPLLDSLHHIWGRYAEVADFIPAEWYEPRKRYIEYMARLLYTVHARENTYRDSHPLHVLRSLYFPASDIAKDERFSDPNHPYNFLTSAITDPNDRNRVVFQKLVPLYADLPSYLKRRRWQSALNDEAEHLAELVEPLLSKSSNRSDLAESRVTGLS